MSISDVGNVQSGVSMVEVNRVAELENILGEVINYLRSMPVCPATYAMAKAAENILHREDASVPLVSYKYHPCGLLLLGLRVDQRGVTLNADRPPSKRLEDEHKEHVYEGLLQGLQMPTLAREGVEMVKPFVRERW